MVRRSRAAIRILSVLCLFSGMVGEAAAQDPSQTASNEVTFVGSWAITAGAGAGDGDDYWLIFFRPGRGPLPLNVDEEDIDGTGDFLVQETGTWRLQFTHEDEPQNCEPLDCNRVVIRHLVRDSTIPNRWLLGLRTPDLDPDNDLDLKLDRIVPGSVGPALFAVQMSASTVHFSWPPFPGATSYQIEAGNAPGLSNVVPPSNIGDITFLPASGPPGTYFVRLRAFWAGGLSGPSNEVQVTLGVCNPLPAPTLLQYAKTGTLLTLTWQGVGGSNNTRLLVGSSPLTPSNLLNLEIGTVFIFQADVSSVPPGIYYVRVAAQNGCGMGVPSDYVAITIP